MTFPHGSPDSHYESVVHALHSDNVLLVENTIKVIKLVSPYLPYEVRKDMEKVIAEELFHDRCPAPYRADWAALNLYLGGLP